LTDTRRCFEAAEAVKRACITNDLEEMDMAARDMTKEDLYREAKRLGFKGRSKASEVLRRVLNHVTDLEAVDMATPDTKKEVDMPTRDKTKEQLYREAKRLGIKVRSKMNKGQLRAAVNRRGG
jgi:hypothetical protein